MGFLRRVKAPDELPDLAIEDGSVVPAASAPAAQATPATQTTSASHPITKPLPSSAPAPSNISSQKPDVTTISSHKEIAGEDFLEFQDKVVQKAAGSPESLLEMAKEDKDKAGFFSKVLDDINDEMGDLGKLEDWYQGNFAQQDVVSDMKSYWEDNKADMIIRSFGSEYKKKIAGKVSRLQELENEWREIYFSLVKKEEAMKREEKELKETVSEFVDLCKRRKGIQNDEEDAQASAEASEETSTDE